MSPAFGGQGGQNTALTLYANKGVILEADWLCCSETIWPVYATRPISGAAAFQFLEMSTFSW